MTLKQDTDPGGSLFVLTICDSCEADDTASEEKLQAAGWTWDDYPDGPHQCPDCYEPEHPEDYGSGYGVDEDPNYRAAMKDAGRGHLLR